MTEAENVALSRLRAFRQSWNDGDVIDEDSGLTADDLDVVLALGEQGAKTVAIKSIDLRQSGTLRD